MGVLLDGKYYKNPEDAPSQSFAAVGAQLEGYNLHHQAQKYDRELIQPWLPDGNANPEFIKYFPKEAKEYGMEVN